MEERDGSRKRFVMRFVFRFPTPLERGLPNSPKNATGTGLAAENPLKQEVLQEILKKHQGEQILVIGQYVDQLKALAERFDAPLITGSTPQPEREEWYRKFRKKEISVLFVSKVANMAIDLPDAKVAVQVSGTFGSRQEEAQRLGRILRPKANGQKAYFYQLVTQDTVDQEYALATPNLFAGKRVSLFRRKVGGNIMMRVRELRYCLTSLSDAERKHIANALDLQEESLAAMEQKLTDPAYYQDCLQKMDRKTYRWFWSVFLKKGKIKKQALHQEKNLPLSKVEYQHLLDAACGRGWIYCLRNRHMERMYYVPWEIRVAWCRSISVAQSLRPLDEERVIPVQSNPLKASQAFFHFLTSLSHEPWLLNRTGHLSKKDLKKMDVELDLDDVHASWPGWSGFLLETARLLGLVTETKKHVAVHQTRWKSWLSTSAEKVFGQLYDAVRHVLLKDHPELDGFCLILEQLPAGTWWGLEQFWRRLKTEVPLKMPFQFIKRLQEGFITPMACMGWLESGRTGKRRNLFPMDVLSPQGVGGSRRNAGLCRSSTGSLCPVSFSVGKAS